MSETAVVRRVDADPRKCKGSSKPKPPDPAGDQPALGPVVGHENLICVHPRLSAVSRCIPILSTGSFLLALSLVVGCASNDRKNGQASPPALPESYMRVVHPDQDTVELQIAARRFNPARGRGPDVWLVGASHIGDSNYFAALQKRLDAQPLVLFEGVGARSKKMRFNPDEESSVQHALATSLGLVFQLSAIDYDRPHFQNSDLSIAQLQSLFQSGGGSNAAGTRAGQEFQELLQIMNGSSFLGALVHFGIKFIGSNPRLQALTKVVLIELLGQIKGDLAQLKGMPPEIQRLLEVIIQERNKIVVEDVRKELAARSPRDMAVFYGAGHMADLEKRLRAELNYVPRKTVWFTAMSVNTRKAGLSETELDGMRKLIEWQLNALNQQ